VALSGPHWTLFIGLKIRGLVAEPHHSKRDPLALAVLCRLTRVEFPLDGFRFLDPTGILQARLREPIAATHASTTSPVSGASATMV